MCGLAQIGVQDDSKPAEHPDDFDAAVYDAIEDGIAIYGEAAKTDNQFRPVPANLRELSQHVALLVN